MYSTHDRQPIVHPGGRGRGCPWASHQIRKIAGCACAGHAGNVFPTTNFKATRYLAIPACITARAWRTCRDACRDRQPAMAGKTFRHSRRMRNSQFCVSGKRPIVSSVSDLCSTLVTKSSRLYIMLCWTVLQLHPRLLTFMQDLFLSITNMKIAYLRFSAESAILYLTTWTKLETLENLTDFGLHVYICTCVWM